MTAIHLLCNSAIAIPIGEGGGPAPKIPPAAVEGRVTESSLTTITLTVEAAGRLAIATEPVTERAIPSRRRFGGVVEVAPGCDRLCTAPVAGWVVRAASIGERVVTGDVVAVIRVGADADGRLLSVADRITLERALADLGAARVEAGAARNVADALEKAAEIELSRAEKLADEKAGSQRSVDDARANAARAIAEREGATRREESLARAIEALSRSPSFDLELIAPFSGEVSAIHASGGAFVSAGATVVRLTGVDDLVIRVAVPNAIAPALDRTRAWAFRGAALTVPWVELAPAPAPVSIRGTSAAVELTFSVRAASFDPPLTPGERIVLALNEGTTPGVTVPHASILRDASGGEWVYVETGERTFSRRRVIVSDIVEGRAVLALGPDLGNEVVTDGAAELFGTEFGAGK